MKKSLFTIAGQLALIAVFFAALFVTTSCQNKSKSESENQSGIVNDFRIKRGTNISHWLSQSEQRGEARRLHIQEDDFARLEELGFDFVRIPIDEVQFWDEQGNKLPEAWDLLNNALDWARKHNLRAIVDLHIIRSHYFNAVNEGDKAANTLFTSEKAQEDLINLWRQLSDFLKERSCDWVAYEFMNEPVAEEHEQWNQLIAKVHKALRELEPQRTLVIGSNLWQGHQTIKYLKVPEGDKNIILSFHYYNPMILTHYGAWWSPLCAAYKGKVNYPGVLVSKEDYDAAPAAIKEELKPYTEEVWDINKIREQFKDAIEAAKKYDLQLFCGEWGVYEPVDRELAYNWYRDMLTVFDEFDIAWTTWCYDADFGFWDQQRHTFKDRPLVELLMSGKKLEEAK
ncbi:MAG: cellulase family glycosylhydrolase [Prevotella sp.]|nr:cellulase family glycosylhydrolase [Prevotella sp.]